MLSCYGHHSHIEILFCLKIIAAVSRNSWVIFYSLGLLRAKWWLDMCGWFPFGAYVNSSVVGSGFRGGRGLRIEIPAGVWVAL